MKIISSKTPWYLAFFAAYPVLSLLGSNIREVESDVVYRPLLVSLLLVALIFAAVELFLREGKKAALATALFTFLFFLYGHVYEFARHVGLLYDFGGPHAVLAILFLALFAAGTRAILHLKDHAKIIPVLTLIGAFLTAYPLVRIGIFYSQKESAPPAPETKVDTPQRPDIYYVILDGYSREDTMETFGGDISGFIGELKDMGFYVAPCARANYRGTLLSLTSSLNMDYIYNAIPHSGPADTNLEPIYHALQYNKVRETLKEQGYRIISFKTGYEWDEWRDSDQFLYPALEETPFLYPAIQPFEYLLLQTTALRPLLQNGFLAREHYIEHYNRVHYMLDELPKIASQPGPKFVYAHFMTPHAPFIFLPDGSINPDYNYYITEAGIGADDEYTRLGYLNNVQFISSRIPPILKQIITESRQPPIIILQGDHGVISEEFKYNILNAYHFPGEAKDDLYATITPINTFRLVFDRYFNIAYGLRPDKSISTDPGRPYRQRIAPPFPAECP